jgi:PAS domain S-box-containing protein
MNHLLEALPGLYLILKPDPPRFTILDANEAYLKSTGIDRTAIGQGVFEVFPDNPDNPTANGVLNLSNSLMEVINKKKQAVMKEQRYDSWNTNTKKFDTRYWGVINIPVFDTANNLVSIIHIAEDKTEQTILKQSEQNIKKELLQLHDLQHSIIENLQDGYISVDNDWLITNCNKNTELLFDRPCEHIVSTDLLELLKSDGLETFAAYCKEALTELKSTHFQQYLEHKGRWLIVNAYPTNQGLIIFLVDNTDNKNEEEKIKDNETRFRALVENIADGIIILAANTAVIEISQSAQNILDLKDDINGRLLKDIFYGDDLPLIQETFEEVVRNNEAVLTIQFRFLSPGGKLRWLEGTFQNLLEERSVKAVILICRDITDRIIQEERLRVSEEKYRHLFYSSPASIIIWTLQDFRIREVNQTAMDLYGYTMEEFRELTVLDIRTVEEQKRLIDIAIEMREKSVKKSSLSVHLNKQQKRMYMNIAYFKITFNNEPAILALAIDSTEKIALEEKLAKERSRRQNEITKAVINAQENERAELSKELHDNINQILTTTRLLVERGLANKMDHEAVLNLNLEYLTTAIKEIRKLSQSLMPPSLHEVTLHEAVNHMISNYNAINPFEINYTNNLKDEEILNEQTKLTIFRIIQELLNNIVRHAEASIVQLRIIYNEKLLTLFISDNGKGFVLTPDNRGLGLRNITSRANLFGGQVSIHSKLNMGTEVKVVFTLSTSLQDSFA